MNTTFERVTTEEDIAALAKISKGNLARIFSVYPYG